MTEIKDKVKEGHFIFKFPSAQAMKYDDGIFYRQQFNNCCCGNKAVDIIYLEEDTLWLIEVKDYRRERRTKPIDLADEVAIKVRDTLAGLVSSKFKASESQEQTFARSALQKKYLKVILHLEQPAHSTKLFPRVIEPSDLIIKLKQQLKAIDPHPKVVDRETLKQVKKINWIVEKS